MKIAKGVEWAAHACAILALLPPEKALSKEALAEFLGIPSPYLAKQLQALSRAGLVTAQRGVSGGYRLSRTSDDISLWDITAAIEGTAPSFRCTEVRRQGPCGAPSEACSAPCDIAAAFWRAEAGYRQSLAATKLAGLIAGMAVTTDQDRRSQINTWLAQNAAGRA